MFFFSCQDDPHPCAPQGGEEGGGSWVIGGTSMNVITDTYHALRSMRKRQVGGLPPDQPCGRSCEPRT